MVSIVYIKTKYNTYIMSRSTDNRDEPVNMQNLCWRARKPLISESIILLINKYPKYMLVY